MHMTCVCLSTKTPTSNALWPPNNPFDARPLYNPCVYFAASILQCPEATGKFQSSTSPHVRAMPCPSDIPVPEKSFQALIASQLPGQTLLNHQHSRVLCTGWPMRCGLREIPAGLRSRSVHHSFCIGATPYFSPAHRSLPKQKQAAQETLHRSKTPAYS